MTIVHLGYHFHKEKIAIIYLTMQVILIALFAVFGNYHKDADARYAPNDESRNDFSARYGMFQDVHIMIFVGFGFLMTFLKRYGYSAIGFNFLLAAIAIQWSLFLNGILHSESDGQFKLSVKSLIAADFSSASVLISFGVLIGKTSPLQLLVLAIIEVFCFECNIFIGEHLLGATDAGGSMFIHMFGAYFGLAVSFVLNESWHNHHKGNVSTYNSDLFAMIGSLFLWICWPTFNGALLGTIEQQHRVAINTYMSLAACVATAFATSLLVSKQSRLEMDLVQNATLAGGVAVGTCADLMILPVGAMAIGAIVGVVSVLGFHYLSPLLADKFRIHDTCGVHNLHGLPGLMAGIFGVIAAACARPVDYQVGLSHVFSHRKAYFDVSQNAWLDVPDDVSRLNPNASASYLALLGLDQDDHHYRTAGEQAGYQAAALVITLVVSIVTGLITGFILKLDFLIPVSQTQAFHDEPYWSLPDDVVQEPKPHKFSIAYPRNGLNMEKILEEANGNGTEIRERNGGPKEKNGDIGNGENGNETVLPNDRERRSSVTFNN